MSREDHRDAGTWTVEPTPTSRRRMDQEQARKEAQRPAVEVAHLRPALARPLTDKELREIEALSRAGVVLTPEQTERRKSGLERRLLQHGMAWLPPDEAA
jgi:hypothetical protein